MSSGLPEYKRPPVVEVMLAVAFAPLGLSIVDLSEFGRANLSVTLPEVQEQPPVQMPIEPGRHHQPMPGVGFSLLQGPPSPRLWFRSSDGTKLVQIQRDWFGCNWQDATGTAGSYPRFPSIEEFFLENYQRFERFTTVNTGHEPVPTQCEVTYVNHIRPTATWQRAGQAHLMNRLVGVGGDYLPEPEEVAASARYPMEVDGQLAGRLHVSLVPGYALANLGPVLTLTLIGRGAPRATGLDGVRSMFHLAHEGIVEGFALASPAAEVDWERVRD